MKKLKSTEIVLYMIMLLQEYLEELKNYKDVTDIKSQFCYGSKTAYTECLDILQMWEFAGEIWFKIRHRKEVSVINFDRIK